MSTQSFIAGRCKAVLGGITLTLSAVLVAWGAASSSFAPVCAARDLDVITLIEDHGMAEDVASERLAQAAMTMLAAREACDAGRTEKAVALYEGIIGSLGPMLSERTH